MHERARANESRFRHTAAGREAIAPPNEGGSHVHYQPRRSVGLGCITSKPRPTVTFLEVLSYETGLTVEQVRKALERDELK